MTAALHNPHGTAFGLMDEVYGPGTAQALRDSGGPWETWHGFEWGEVKEPSWSRLCAYRIKPQPPKPREWWIARGMVFDFAEQAEAERAFYDPNGELIHVREVIE